MNAKQIPLRPGGFELTEIAANEASLSKDSRVLDIGCGTGASLLYIWKHFGCRVFGVDCSEKAIEAAKACLFYTDTAATDRDATDAPSSDYNGVCGVEPIPPRLLTADASALPFEDNSFDLVMMECTLTLFKDPIRALAEATRVLKSGGMLFISALTQRETTKGSVRVYPAGNTSGPDSDSHSASPELVNAGLLQMDSLRKHLSDIGYHHITCTERNDVLVQFVADAIFTYGSLDNYIKEASACIDGCVLNCNISPKEAGYAYILAQKT